MAPEMVVTLDTHRGAGRKTQKQIAFGGSVEVAVAFESIKVAKFNSSGAKLVLNLATQFKQVCGWHKPTAGHTGRRGGSCNTGANWPLLFGPPPNESSLVGLAPGCGASSVRPDDKLKSRVSPPLAKGPAPVVGEAPGQVCCSDQLGPLVATLLLAV